MADGTQVTVSGTLFGKNQVPKLTEVDGFDIDLGPVGLPAVLRLHRPARASSAPSAPHSARPTINIAGAQVSRTTRGGEALMAVTVDSPVPAELLGDIAEPASGRARPGPPTSPRLT